MPQKSLKLTASNLLSSPSRKPCRQVEKSAEHGSPGGVAVSELMEHVSMSFAPHLDRADVRALVDRLAFA